MAVSTEQESTTTVPRAAWSLQRAMHRLWADHAIWTRDYVVAAIADAPDAEMAANRLLRNQEDIGNAIVPLYGDDAGRGLTDLLRQHILIAVDLVDAAKAGDKRRFKREDKRWDDNAAEIAAFLAGANPNWPEDDVRDLLAQHLELTRQEVVARLEENWEGDVAAFDDILTEILTLADALSEGIVKQFPEKFTDEAGGPNGAVTREAWSLQRAMHRLWIDHTAWTRGYVVAALADSSDAEAAAGRLLRNQEDIGNAIVPLYGEEAGAKLTDLLKQHILIAVDLVDAAKKGDQKRFAQEDKRWDDNAAEIAAFLSGANPNWPQDDVQDLIAQHLELTQQEVVARLQGEWEKDVSAFDDIMTEILTLADALSDGIVAQFPQMFGGSEAAAGALHEEAAEAPTEDGVVTREAWSLQRAMHRLWADHAMWTRDYVVAALAGAPDAKAAADRLLRNQEDIGNAIVPFYGEEAGKGLTLHLKEHILIAVDLIELVKAEDFGERFEELDRRWDSNAADIARFLGDLNPYWPEKDVKDLLAQHLALTKQEVDARLFGDWERDVAAFDDIMTEILTLADALSAGLVKQFPERFGGGGSGGGAAGVTGERDGGVDRSEAREKAPKAGAAGARARSSGEGPSRRVTRPGPITRSSSRGSGRSNGGAR
jgi:glutamate synthase domain-containing protein 3